MPRNTRTSSPVTVSLAKRVLRRWHEGVVVMNLTLAGYLAQLPRLEHVLSPEGALEVARVGLGAGLGWMLVRGLFTSRYDFSQLDHGDSEPAPVRRQTSAPPQARIMTVGPSQARPSHSSSASTPASSRPSAQPRQSSLPSPPPTLVMPPPERPSLQPPRRSETPPVRGSTPARRSSLPPPNTALERFAHAMPPPANDSVPPGQPRPLEADAYIDTVGEAEPVARPRSSQRPSQRPGPSDSPVTVLDVIVMEQHALPRSGVLPSIEPDLLHQLEDVRAELIALSPSACFVVGVSSDAEHRDTKTEAAVQLALSLALSGSRRVLLLEADATHPVLDRMVGLDVPHAAGVSQQLHRRMTAHAPTWTVMRVAESLDVLAEGRFRTPGVFYGPVFATALSELRLHYDVIVADGPIVETTESATTFGEVTDGIAYLTSGMPSIRMPRERALVRFHEKRLFKVLAAS